MWILVHGAAEVAATAPALRKHKNNKHTYFAETHTSDIFLLLLVKFVVVIVVVFLISFHPSRGIFFFLFFFQLISAPERVTEKNQMKMYMYISVVCSFGASLTDKQTHGRAYAFARSNIVG